MGNRCEEHARDFEARRGSKQSRGYDRAYDVARVKAARVVLAGRAVCWRCGERIEPGDEWHLGHADNGRIAGPEHARTCNLRAAGLKSKGLPWAPPAPLSDDLTRSRAEAQERAAKALRRRTERLRARSESTEE